MRRGCSLPHARSRASEPSVPPLSVAPCRPRCRSARGVAPAPWPRRRSRAGGAARPADGCGTSHRSARRRAATVGGCWRHRSSDTPHDAARRARLLRDRPQRARPGGVELIGGVLLGARQFTDALVLGVAQDRSSRQSAPWNLAGGNAMLAVVGDGGDAEGGVASQPRRPAA